MPGDEDDRDPGGSRPRWCDEVKDIRDKTRAIEMYVRHPQNTETEEQARNIRLKLNANAGRC